MKNCRCDEEGDRGGQGESQGGGDRVGEEKPHGQKWAKLYAAVSAQSHWMDLLEEKHLGPVLFLPLLSK